MMKGTSVNNSKTCSVASSSKSSSSKYSLLRASNGRSIHHSIASVQRKVKNFNRKHLVSKAKIDFNACARFLEDELLPQWQISANELGSYDQFLRLTLRKSLDEQTASSDGFIDLLGLSERAQDFENLLKVDKKRLASILEQHILNTCVSLKEEDDGSNLTNVSEYDQIVWDYRSKIIAKWEELDSSITEYENNYQSFQTFVQNGEGVCSSMRKVCNVMLEVCKLSDEWVTEDEAYPAKLEEEMASTTTARDEAQVNIGEVQQKKAENNREIDRLQKLEEKAERMYYDFRRDKKKVKQRLVELEDRKDSLNSTLSKKRKERDQLKTQLSGQGLTSPRDVYDVNARMTSLETGIDRLEEQKRITVRQLKRVGNEVKPISDKTYENKVEMVTLRHHKENVMKENCDLDIDLNTLQKRLTFFNSLLAKLKNIREMKLSGEAFRKSLRARNRREKAYANGSHDLEEACKIAALGIGKDWKTVYFRLPFDPPRDPARLQRDVSVLDHIAYRGDIPPEKQALKCLERWRTLHKKGDINELIQALKDVKKKRLATEIHYKFVPVAV